MNVSFEVAVVLQSRGNVLVPLNGSPEAASPFRQNEWQGVRSCQEVLKEFLKGDLDLFYEAIPLVNLYNQEGPTQE